MRLDEAKEILKKNGYLITENSARFDFDNFIDSLKASINFPINKLKFSSDYSLGNNPYPHCVIKLRGSDEKLSSQKKLAEIGYKYDSPWPDKVGLKVIIYNNGSLNKNIYEFSELSQQKIEEIADMIRDAAIGE